MISSEASQVTVVYLSTCNRGTLHYKQLAHQFVYMLAIGALSEWVVCTQLCTYVAMYVSSWSYDGCPLCSHTAHQLESQRELLMKKLVEAEMDGSAMTKQVDTLKRTLKKIEKVGSQHCGWWACPKWLHYTVAN